MSKTTWQTKALEATRGSRLGAIIACALNTDRDATPRFEGTAFVTSDGFLMCNFVDRDGEPHWGAFVGDFSDLKANVIGLTEHLKLNEADAKAFRSAVMGWVHNVQ